MKRLIFIMAVGMITGVQAQTKSLLMDHENFFRFGVKGGLNLNKISGTSYKSGFNYNFQLGGFLQFNVTNRIGIQPELSFVQSKAEFSSDGTDIYDDIFGGGNQHKASLNYLEIPVLLNVNIGISKRVKFQIGPAYGGLLKSTVDSLQTGIRPYKNSEWSAIAGFWLQLPLVNGGIRYKYGITNVNAIDNREAWHNQAVQIFVGLTF